MAPFNKLRLCKKPSISIPMYFLVMFFNVSSWVDVDGLWAEMPLLVQRLPEYWTLASSFGIIAMSASIGPVVFMTGNALKPTWFRQVPATFFIIGVGFASLFLQIFLWHKTVAINGSYYSVAFLVLLFIAAFTDCSSCVVFLAYMSRLPEEYLSAYYVGDGLSGLIPSIGALIQGAGGYDCVNRSLAIHNNKTVNTARFINKTEYPGYQTSSTSYSQVDSGQLSVQQNGSSYHNASTSFGWRIEQDLYEPLFSIEAFISILASLMVVSGICFAFINYLPWCKKFHVKTEDELNALRITDASTCWNCNINDKPNVDSVEMEKMNQYPNENVDDGDVVVEGQTPSTMSRSMFLYLVMHFGLMYGIRYGMLHPMQTYSLLPYGSLAYSLGNRLTTAVLPLSAAMALFVKTTSVTAITIQSLVGFVAALYIAVFAVMSPNPPLRDTPALGGTLMVLAWLTMSVSWGYCKVGIATKVRLLGDRPLMWIGLTMPIFALIFSVPMFLIINVYGLMKDAPPCPGMETG